MTYIYDKIKGLRFASADDRYSTFISGYYADLNKQYIKRKVSTEEQQKDFDEEFALPYLETLLLTAEGDELVILNQILHGTNEEQEYGDFAHVDANQHIFGKSEQRINFASSSDMSMAFRYSYVANTINKTFLGNKKLVNILDIGCSLGTFYQFWRGNFQPIKKPTINYLGLDIRTKAIDYCKEHLENPDKGIRFLELDIMKDPIPEGPKYDVILFMEIVEHVPVSVGREMMAKIHDELLADDGIVFISSPSPKKELGQMLTNPNDHIFEYSAREMEAMIHEFGFEVVDYNGWFCRGRFMRAGLNDAELELYDKIGRLGSGLRAAIFSF